MPIYGKHRSFWAKIKHSSSCCDRVSVICFCLFSNRYKSVEPKIPKWPLWPYKVSWEALWQLVKQQVEAQKKTNTQIANLTEALLAHGGPPAAPSAVELNPQSSWMPALQLPQFRHDKTTYNDVKKFLKSFNIQTTHLQATTKLTLLQQAYIGKWQNPCCQWKRPNLHMKQHLFKVGKF